MEHVSLKTMPEEERPREKLVRFGADKLTNAELIGIIIRTGSRGLTAVELGRQLMQTFENDLSAFFNMSIEELKVHPDLKGIGMAKACQLKAAIELGMRVRQQRLNKTTVSSSKDVAELLMGEMAYLKKEHFMVLILDTKNRILKKETVSVGTVNASLVHPREVFTQAIRLQATSVIVAHNHPSGDPFPSYEDRQVTTRLCEAGQILGIDVLDHLILGDHCYFSFKEKGLI